MSTSTLFLFFMYFLMDLSQYSLPLFLISCYTVAGRQLKILALDEFCSQRFVRGGQLFFPNHRVSEEHTQGRKPIIEYELLKQQPKKTVFMLLEMSLVQIEKLYELHEREDWCV